MDGAAYTPLGAEDIDRIRQEVLEFAGIGLFRYRFDGTILFMDRGAMKIFEIEDRFSSPEAVTGANISDLIEHIQPRGMLRAALKEAGAVRGFEYEFITMRGTHKWIIRDAYVVTDGDTGEDVVHVLVRDITERKRANQQLVESEQRLKRIIDSIQSGLAIIDPETSVIVDVNAVAARMLGVSAEGLVGASCRDLICPGGGDECSVDCCNKNLDKAERNLRRADGSSLPVLKTVVPIDLAGKTHLLESFVDISERKEAEEALRHSEAKFHQIYEEAPVMMHSVDSDGVFCDVNRKWLEVTGYERDDVLGKCLDFLMTPDSVKQAHEQVMPSFQTSGFVKDVEFQYVTKSGHIIDVMLDCVASVDPSGQEVRLSVVRDVTEQKRNQQALQLANIFLNAVNDAIIVVDTDTTQIRDCNDKAAEMFGFPRKDLLDMMVIDLGSGTSPYTDDAFSRQLMAEHSGMFEWQARHQQGSTFWVEINPTHVVADGDTRIIASIRDVSQRKEAEEELVRIREALDDCGSAVIIVDEAMDITYINTSFGQLFGVTREGAHESQLPSFFAEPEMAPEIITKILSGGSWQDELQMRGKDGRFFPASVRGTPVLDDMFEVTGILFILNDVTERKALEAQVMQSQNMKSIGQLAAGVAHEINTPMQYVGDNTRFLQDSFKDLLRGLTAWKEFMNQSEAGSVDPAAVSALKDLLEEIDLDYLTGEIPVCLEQSLEGIERVTNIVRAMRQFTHPGTAEKKTIDLNEAIRSTVTVARNEWKYVAEVEMSLDESLPLVPCLPGDFNQVMLNLIVNAAHAIGDAVDEEAGEKGCITIQTTEAGDTVEVRVQDTGTGIPVAVQERVFDPFFTTKPVGKGTGQGLAISHAVIVEKHGGTLTFETEEGSGTTFIIRLPLSDTVEITAEENPERL